MKISKKMRHLIAIGLAVGGSLTATARAQTGIEFGLLSAVLGSLGAVGAVVAATQKGES